MANAFEWSICIVLLIKVREKEVSWWLYLASYESSFYFWNHAPAVRNANKHQGRHSISPPPSHLRPVPICSFAFRAQHTWVLLFLLHLLHPLTAENEERRAQLHSDSTASETSCKVTLCPPKKSVNGKRWAFFGMGVWSRAADLKSYSSVLQTLCMPMITWAQKYCVQEKDEPYISQIS